MSAAPGSAGGSRADEQRQRIRTAAARVFSRRGYRATSMNEIASLVGLSKPTLYHYVPNKEHLLVGIYEDVLEESLRSARAIVAGAPTPLDAVRGLVVDRVVYTCAHQDLLKICFEEESELPEELLGRILERRRAYEAVVLGAVTAHLDVRGVGLPVAPRVYVNVCLGAANWVYKWFDPHGPRSARQLGEDVAAVVLPVLGGAVPGSGPSGTP